MSTPFAAIDAGGRLAARRIATRSSLLACAAAAAGVVGGGLIERRVDAAGAFDHTLSGVALGAAMPLVALWFNRAASDASRLADACDVLARQGVSRRSLALGVGLGATVITAVVGGLLVLVAGGAAGALREAVTAAWLGALGGGACASLAVLGSTFGRTGGGRGLLLALDWLLGTGTTLVALPWPRAHLRALLGAEPVLGFSQRGSTLVLCASLAVFLLAASWRTPP